MVGDSAFVALVFVGVYLIGNLSLSYTWIKFIHKQDLRTLGSGSLGARNAGRFLGKSGFFITLLFDFVKGILAVLCTAALTEHELIINLAAVLVVTGHVWPVLLGFRGGKGIVTTIGALFAIHPLIPGLLIVIFASLYLLTRNVIISGVISFLLLPPMLMLLGYGYTYSIPVSLCGLIIVWTHKSNLKAQWQILNGGAR